MLREPRVRGAIHFSTLLSSGNRAPPGARVASFSLPLQPAHPQMQMRLRISHIPSPGPRGLTGGGGYALSGILAALWAWDAVSLSLRSLPLLLPSGSCWGRSHWLNPTGSHGAQGHVEATHAGRT